MVSTDPISDMFSRIRNAAMVNKHSVEMPHSKVKEAVAKILVDNGYIKSAKVREVEGRKSLDIEIAIAGQPSTITEIKRLSRPGRRVYVEAKEIPTVRRGRGIVIISTSKGMMSGVEAKKSKLGGELICEVY